MMPVQFQFRTPMCAGFFSLQINIANADKVSKINKAFAEIQKEVQQLSKGTAAEPPKNQQEPANVDAATSLLSQL
uniref:Uncharacterized protein n=1 Tax=Meleagris gallopavo TaxID=9103 RepID=A0A803YF58_MELGA